MLLIPAQWVRMPCELHLRTSSIILFQLFTERTELLAMAYLSSYCDDVMNIFYERGLISFCSLSQSTSMY